jgi:hypothetical protein
VGVSKYLSEIGRIFANIYGKDAELEYFKISVRKIEYIYFGVIKKIQFSCPIFQID